MSSKIILLSHMSPSKKEKTLILERLVKIYRWFYIKYIQISAITGKQSKLYNSFFIMLNIIVARWHSA